MPYVPAALFRGLVDIVWDSPSGLTGILCTSRFLLLYIRDSVYQWSVFSASDILFNFGFAKWHITRPLRYSFSILWTQLDGDAYPLWFEAFKTSRAKYINNQTSAACFVWLALWLTIYSGHTSDNWPICFHIISIKNIDCVSVICRATHHYCAN